MRARAQALFLVLLLAGGCAVPVSPLADEGQLVTSLTLRVVPGERDAHHRPNVTLWTAGRDDGSLPHRFAAKLITTLSTVNGSDVRALAHRTETIAPVAFQPAPNSTDPAFPSPWGRDAFPRNDTYRFDVTAIVTKGGRSYSASSQFYYYGTPPNASVGR